jgi:hypothetical protein
MVMDRTSCFKVPSWTRRFKRGLQSRSVLMYRLEDTDALVGTFAKAGVSIAKKLKKAKHAKEEERLENERVLGPADIIE